MIALLPPPVATPGWPWRRAARLLVATGLLAAACVAGHAMRKGTAVLPPVPPSAAGVPMIAGDTDFPGDPPGWPAHLEAAAGMFLCHPPMVAGFGQGQESVVVWTDKANQVIAFSGLQEAQPLPRYLAPFLSADVALVPHPSVHTAARGHVLRIAREKTTLQLQGLALACARTWDD